MVSLQSHPFCHPFFPSVLHRFTIMFCSLFCSFHHFYHLTLRRSQVKKALYPGEKGGDAKAAEAALQSADLEQLAQLSHMASNCLKNVPLGQEEKTNAKLKLYHHSISKNDTNK